MTDRNSLLSTAAAAVRLKVRGDDRGARTLISAEVVNYRQARELIAALLVVVKELADLVPADEVADHCDEIIRRLADDTANGIT